jgi:alpha-tubulin suppressor-like RCC1 family protein
MRRLRHIRLLIGTHLVLGCSDPSSGPDGSRITALAVDPPLVALDSGASVTLGVTITRGGTTYRTLPSVDATWPADLVATWGSSDSTVVAVSASGVATARRSGWAHVWVRVLDQRAATPVAVRDAVGTPPFGYVAASAAGAHSCGLAADGRAYCWGVNWWGELGTGKTEPHVATVAPVPVIGALAFAALDAGLVHTCALTGDGAAYCWGDNVTGQLGDGTTTNRSRPTPVATALRFTTVSAGHTLTCGLTDKGTAYCWGGSAPGRATRPTPVGRDLRFAAVSAGGNHACGVAIGGTVFCWGDNAYGQLGTGTTISSATPVPIATAGMFEAVTAGGLHTCAIAQGGAAYCWGNNWSGRLGTGSEAASALPARVAGGLAFGQLSAGGEHTCGVTRAGAAYCWGSNWRGQLGSDFPFGDPRYTAAEYMALTPAAVAGGRFFLSISAGAIEHTCGTVVGNAAYCWGLNSGGQLGAGARSTFPGTQLFVRPTPVRVIDPPPPAPALSRTRGR